MTHVVLSGWRPGLNEVRLTKTLQGEGGMGLADAKRVTDQLLDGEPVDLPIRDVTAAERLAESLTALGVAARVERRHPAGMAAG